MEFSSVFELSPLSQNKTGRAIGRWYRQHFRIDCSGEVNLFELVLKIDQNEGNLLPATHRLVLGVISAMLAT
jgi:hypothetical protein